MIFNKHFGSIHIEFAPPKYVHIEWNLIFAQKCHFAHFSRKSKRAPPGIYMHPWSATKVSVSI
jgi:hypothetical protein